MILRITALIASSVLLVAASPQIVTDYSIVLGPPMKTIVVTGRYVDALSLAYEDWLHRKGPKTAIADQVITISPQPGTDLLYVRFRPRQGPRQTIGCTTIYGTEILYVIDAHSRVILRRDIPC